MDARPRAARAVPWAAILIALLAAGLRFWGLFHNLPDDIHVDETQIVRRAVRFGGGDLNPHFFYWPSLSMYLYFGLYGAGYVFGRLFHLVASADAYALQFVRDPSIFYGLARSVEVLADGGTAGALCLLGERSGGRAAGVLAGGAWAVFPLAVETCRHARPDALMVFLSAAALLAALSRMDRRGAWLSGLLWGLSVSAKYNAAALAPAFLVAAVAVEASWRERSFRAGLLFSAAAAGFFVGTPYALIDAATFVRHFFGQSAAVGVGASGGRAVLYYLGQALSPSGSVVLGVTALAGAVLGIFRRNRAAVVLSLSLAGVLLSVFVSGALMPRYFLLGDLVLFALFSVGAGEVLKKVPVPRPAALAVLALVSAGPFVPVTAAYLARASRTDTRASARAWVETHVPPGAALFTGGTGPQLWMSREQIEALHARAQAAGHVKAEYFALQLRAHPGGGYHIYMIREPALTTVKELHEYAEQVQDLVPPEEGLEGLSRRGISYAVITDEERLGLYGAADVKARYPALAKFFEDLGARSTEIAVFDAWKEGAPGPTIRVFRLPGAKPS